MPWTELILMLLYDDDSVISVRPNDAGCTNDQGAVAHTAKGKIYIASREGKVMHNNPLRWEPKIIWCRWSDLSSVGDL